MHDFENDRFRPTPVGLRPDSDVSKWVWIAPAIALLVAILPLPYGYYMGLRWLVAGAAVTLAWKEYQLNQNRSNSYVWIFGLIAVLFNPIIPIHLFKLLWIAVNIIVAATFVGHYKLRLNNS